MKTSMEYLDEAKEKIGISSDNGISKELKITRSAISNYRSGNYIMDDFTAAKIAEILEIDPIIVIAAANAEREKGERKEYWEKLAKRLGGVAAAITFLTALPVQIGNHGLVNSAQADNESIIYIMRNMRKKRAVGPSASNSPHWKRLPLA